MNVRFVRIHVSFILDLLKHGVSGPTVIEAHGLPEDAEVLDVRENHSAYPRWPQVIMLVRSNEFADVPDGEPIPEHPPTQFRKVQAF